MDAPSYCASVKAYLCQRTLEESGYTNTKKQKFLLSPCCSSAFLAGVADSIGKKGSKDIKLVSENCQLLELCSYLLIRSEFTNIVVKTEEGKKSTTYVLSLPLDISFSYPASKECSECLPYYFRGAFISSGYVLDPSNEYHLEVKSKEKFFCEKLLSLAHDADIAFKKTTRRGNHLLYMKDSEDIADFLTLIGGEKYAMELMNKKIFKEISNHTNRINNYDQANLSRVIGSAQTAVEAIRVLRKKGRLESLPRELQEAAMVRESYPDMPLCQLCKQCNPPLTKSGMNHRLQKLISLAKEC